MNAIIAPTDFSATSLNAVDYAADMACMIKSGLTLLHVYSIPVPVSEVPMPAFNVEDIEASAKARMDSLKEKLSNRTGGRLIIHTEVRAGNVVEEIAAYSASVKPYAVVMGAESTGAIERFFFSGQTVKSLRQLQWPLIIVPPLAAFKGIRKVGLACDFREVVESVRVQEVKHLVKQFKAELYVLHVNEKSDSASIVETIEESGLLQEMLHELKPQYHFIKDPEIERGISDFADKNNIDLLIIIPKKHNLIRRLFQHSHSKRMVLHAHIPIMAIHE